MAEKLLADKVLGPKQLKTVVQEEEKENE